MKLVDLLKTSNVIYVGSGVDTEINVNIEDIGNAEKSIVSFYYHSCAGARAAFDKSDVVITDIEDYFNKHNNAILVGNARLSMSEIYRILLGVDNNSIKLIGVTGTNGKTTTATVIYRTLLDIGFNAGFVGTGRIEYNGSVWSDELYSMTTPAPLKLFSYLKKMIDSRCEWCVMEVSSHALDQMRLGLLKFDIAVFTNLSPEHMDYHKSMENYFLAKFRLLEASRLSIINIDESLKK